MALEGFFGFCIFAPEFLQPIQSSATIKKTANTSTDAHQALIDFSPA
jgi:hypothetical protein